MVNRLPMYNYLYLGDNARSPYGTRSFETVYKYTLQCVTWLIEQRCPLIIVACNTASAKALRTIQQQNLPGINPDVRVLGVIRPTTEVIGKYSTTNVIGILATHGTVQSKSYLLEIEKFYPHLTIVQEACPMWVPLVENNEHVSEGADYFIQKHIHNVLSANPQVDTLLLACTHYPLLAEKIQAHLPPQVKLISQGEIVAKSLQSYLNRHPEIETTILKEGQRFFYTTDSPADFNARATVFFGETVRSGHVDL